MGPDAFVVACCLNEPNLAGKVDAVDNVLEGLCGGGELMLLVIVQRHGNAADDTVAVCSSRMTAVQMRFTAIATP